LILDFWQKSWAETDGLREPRRRTALTGDGHEDRHSHGCGHAEPNTADTDRVSLEVRHSFAPLVDREYQAAHPHSPSWTVDRSASPNP